ncbi:MAG: SOS response-associated peptidase family protein [Planctomycetales bacterium]|nr:SOS response-associated peptidase family protein [Planctomycetales bacterium]
MCNLYDVDPEQVNALFDRIAEYDDAMRDWTTQVFPKMDAPVVLLVDDKPQVSLLRFGLIPKFSKGQPKQPLNNARVEKLSSWPWKTSVGQFCAIPMTSFYEFSYWGEQPGHKLKFSFPESRSFTAGIYNGKSMTMLTRPACESMMEMGHHRMPLFIEPDSVETWIASQEKNVDACYDTLRSIAIDPEFECDSCGQMKDGWQKRINGRIKKRDEQLALIEEHGALGID